MDAIMVFGMDAIMVFGMDNAIILSGHACSKCQLPYIVIYKKIL